MLTIIALKKGIAPKKFHNQLQQSIIFIKKAIYHFFLILVSRPQTFFNKLTRIFLLLLFFFFKKKKLSEYTKAPILQGVPKEIKMFRCYDNINKVLHSSRRKIKNYVTIWKHNKGVNLQTVFSKSKKA